MCGGCGAGPVRGPWEDAVTGRGPRELARRSSALTRLLAPLRRRAAPWGSSGYVVSGPTGVTTTATGLDAVTADAARDPRWAQVLARHPREGLGPAEAVVLLSALVAAGEEVVHLRGPVREGPALVHVHGRAVALERAPGAFSLAGPAGGRGGR